MNERIEKIKQTMDKLKARMEKDQQRFKALEKQLKTSEDEVIVATVRSLALTPEEWFQKMKATGSETDQVALDEGAENQTKELNQ